MFNVSKMPFKVFLGFKDVRRAHTRMKRTIVLVNDISHNFVSDLKFTSPSVVGKTTQESHLQLVQTLLLDFRRVVDDGLNILFAIKVFPFECVFAFSACEIYTCLTRDIERRTERLLKLFEYLCDAWELVRDILVQRLYESVRKTRIWNFEDRFCNHLDGERRDEYRQIPGDRARLEYTRWRGSKLLSQSNSVRTTVL